MNTAGVMKPTILQRILRAAEWGAGLALAIGCSGESTSSEEADSGDGAPALQPYEVPAACAIGPAPGEVCGEGTCGGCCERVACIDVDADSGACPVASSQLKLPGGPVGSGTCECSQMQGPFGPHTAGELPCCYSFGIIMCEGRPFLAQGVARVANIVSRKDWLV